MESIGNITNDVEQKDTDFTKLKEEILESISDEEDKVSKDKSPVREPSVEADSGSEKERNQIAKGLSDLIDKSDEDNIENGLSNSENDVEVIGTVENES